MSMTPKKPSWPVPSAVMAWEEFVEATGIAPERLEELLSLGWIETRTSAARQYFFRDAGHLPRAQAGAHLLRF